MKKFEIVTKAQNILSKTTLGLQKHSPEILVVAGVVGVVASAVMACKATVKAQPIVDQTKKDLTEIKEKYAANDATQEQNEEAPAATEAKKEMRTVYVKTGLEFVKLYAPAVTLGALSITAIFASNNILRKRNIGLAAALTTSEKAFESYRGRVIERFGDKVDKELQYNLKPTKTEETVVDEKTGKEKKKMVDGYTVDPKSVSDYAVIFDKYTKDDHGNMVPNHEWTPNYDYNQMRLNGLEMMLTDKLRAKGHLYLNEVRTVIGLPETKAGQIVGWIYDPKDPSRDNIVSFGREDFPPVYDDEGNRAILLNFNVDGNIWECV